MTQASVPTTKASFPKSRNAGIDLLRGISILLVVIHHLALRIPLNQSWLAKFLPKRLLDAFSYNGYEAVFVFFVISGFLITTNALERWKSLSGISLRDFYARRASRILPCLLLLLVVLSLLHTLAVPNYTIHAKGQSLGGALFAALTLQLNWYEGKLGYLPASWDVLWSLSIEEVFYLLFPLFCLIVRKDKIRVFLLALFSLSLPYWHWQVGLAGNEIWLEKAYLPGMAAIATGVLAALLAPRLDRKQRAIAAPVCFCLGVAALLSVFFAEDRIWKVLGDGCMLLLTLGTAFVLIACHWRHETNRHSGPLRWIWIRSCGRLSYEIYLTHIFVVWWVVAIFRPGGKNVAYGFLGYIPLLGISWFLGWLTACCYSVPVERELFSRLRSPPRV